MSRKPPKMDMIGMEGCGYLRMYYYSALHPLVDLCIIYVYIGKIGRSKDVTCTRAARRFYTTPQINAQKRSPQAMGAFFILRRGFGGKVKKKAGF